MSPKQENRSQGSVELKTQLYRLKYFRSRKQFEQYKRFYGGTNNRVDLQNTKNSMQARSSDAFSPFQTNLFLEPNDYSGTYLHTPGITYGIRAVSYTHLTLPTKA